MASDSQGFGAFFMRHGCYYSDGPYLDGPGGASKIGPNLEQETQF